MRHPNGRPARLGKETVPAMRKTSFVLIGAATGVALTVIATLPPLAMGEDASPPVTNYKALDLFGDTFARVR